MNNVAQNQSGDTVQTSEPAQKRLWLNLPAIPPLGDFAPPPANSTLADGVLLSRVLAPGQGTTHPGPYDVVVVSYTAWLLDGTTVDASSVRGGPSTWEMAALTEGLRSGLQLMVAGERRRLWIPRQLAYSWSEESFVFDVELVDIKPRRDRPADDQFATPPSGISRTQGGVSYQVLRPGNGTEHPKALSTVTIHYTGWTEDRHVFDDSVARGEPLTVGVDTVMPGLAEGLQRMVVGEKCRLWIPAKLAYAPPGPPQSALVVDVELLAIQRAAPGSPGTVEVLTNSPDATYLLVHPDGSSSEAKGAHTFHDADPGRYRIKADLMKSYALGVVASPNEMFLEPRGRLVITITYRPIIR